MHNKSHPKKNTVNNQEGGILLITMLLLLVLTIIGIAANNTSVTEILISNASKNKQEAFYAAEAGLEHGKLIMSTFLNNNNTDVIKASTGELANWTNLFGDDSPYADVTHPQKPGEKYVQNALAFGKYSYTVTVYDDEYPDPDDGSYQDTDGVIWLRSTSNSENSGSSSVEVSLLGQYVPPTTTKPITGYFGQAHGGPDKDNTSTDVDPMTAENLGKERLDQDA